MQGKPHIELPESRESFDDLRNTAEDLSAEHSMPVQFVYAGFRYTVEKSD